MVWLRHFPGVCPCRVRGTRGYVFATGFLPGRGKMATAWQAKRSAVSWFSTVGSTSVGHAQQSKQQRNGISARKYCGTFPALHQCASHGSAVDSDDRADSLAKPATAT